MLEDDAPDASYRAIADEVNMTEGAVRVGVHRLRRRFARLVRAEIAQTIADASDVDDEIRFLLATLGAQRPPT